MRSNPHIPAFLSELPPESYREIERGEIAIGEGRDDPRVGLVDEGLLEGVIHPRHGVVPRAVLTIVGDRHFFGLECIASGHDIEYRALAPTRLWLFSRRWLEDESAARALRAMLHDASWELARALPAHYIAKLSLEQRVLSKLCDLREACSLPEIEITQEQLASLVGVHRNRVGPVLRILEEEGLVELQYGEILIGDREKLLAAFVRRHPSADDQAPGNAPRPSAGGS